MRSLTSAAALAIALALATGADAGGTLRVCANPNNLPFSNAKGEGFENRLAELIAHDLGETVSYAWTNEHEHFVRKTVNAGKCDVLMGVPAGFGEVDTTVPYYTSGYVFVSRKALDLHSMRDPRLRSLKIGVHLLGDENTPPMEALSRQGITQNITGYMIYRDTQVKQHSRIVDDVAAGKLDAAAVWGPLGGYYARQTHAPLDVTLITDTGGFAPLNFQFAMAIGVRKGNDVLKDRLNAAIARERPAIRNLLAQYGVPIVEKPLQAGG